jgi:hypothetical protein
LIHSKIYHQESNETTFLLFSPRESDTEGTDELSSDNKKVGKTGSLELLNIRKFEDRILERARLIRSLRLAVSLDRIREIEMDTDSSSTEKEPSLMSDNKSSRAAAIMDPLESESPLSTLGVRDLLGGLFGDSGLSGDGEGDMERDEDEEEEEEEEEDQVAVLVQEGRLLALELAQRKFKWEDMVTAAAAAGSTTTTTTTTSATSSSTTAPNAADGSLLVSLSPSDLELDNRLLNWMTRLSEVQSQVTAQDARDMARLGDWMDSAREGGRVISLLEQAEGLGARAGAGAEEEEGTAGGGGENGTFDLLSDLLIGGRGGAERQKRRGARPGSSSSSSSSSRSEGKNGVGGDEDDPMTENEEQEFIKSLEEALSTGQALAEEADYRSAAERLVRDYFDPQSRQSGPGLSKKGAASFQVYYYYYYYNCCYCCCYLAVPYRLSLSFSLFLSFSLRFLSRL